MRGLNSRFLNAVKMKFEMGKSLKGQKGQPDERSEVS